MRTIKSCVAKKCNCLQFHLNILLYLFEYKVGFFPRIFSLEVIPRLIRKCYASNTTPKPRYFPELQGQPLSSVLMTVFALFSVISAFATNCATHSSNNCVLLRSVY